VILGFCFVLLHYHHVTVTTRHHHHHHHYPTRSPPTSLHSPTTSLLPPLHPQLTTTRQRHHHQTRTLCTERFHLTNTTTHHNLPTSSPLDEDAVYGTVSRRSESVGVAGNGFKESERHSVTPQTPAATSVPNQTKWRRRKWRGRIVV
jgi:hypothetical protein